MADVTITGLPNAAALTGAERVPMDQAGVTVDAAASAIAALATAATVGLANVNNTSDLNKPISTATQAALDGKASIGGALGTPTSATLTNATGLPLTTGVTGILPVASGGTGTATPGLVPGANVTISGSWPNQTIAAAGGGGGGGSGTVTSVGLNAPTGFSVTGSPVTVSGNITLAFAAGYSLPLDSSQANWNTAFNDRLRWDGGSTGLDASTGRASLGLGSLATQNGTFSGTSSGTNTGDNAINSLYSGLVSNANHTGDASGSTVLTLATVNANVGSFGSATACSTFTVNAKGLITAASSTPITPAVGSITGLGTGVATALAVNVGSAGAPVVLGGALGTPSGATLTNATGLPLTTGVTGLLPVANGGTGTATPGLVQGANVTISGSWPNQTISASVSGGGGGDALVSQPLSQFAATTSAQLAGVITDETGTGPLVFANSPTLITPALGTPSSGTLTSCTGLPLATGISGFGTGIATALAANTGSAGAPVLFNGAGGTPSSLSLANATGLPVAAVTGLGTGVATALAVNVGSAGAPVLLDGAGGTPSGLTLTNASGLPLTTGVTGLLPVANGGTGTATPGLVQGANVTITGSWPNQTIAASGGGGAANDLYALNKSFCPFQGAVIVGAANPANTLAVIPFKVERSGRVDALQLRVTTAVTSSLFQIAFYASADAVPVGTPIGVTSSISGAAAANLSETLGTPFNLIAGRTYFLAVNVNTGTTLAFLTLPAGSLHAWNLCGPASITGVNNTNAMFNYTISQTYGTWPDLTGATLGTVFGLSRAPIVFLQYGAFV